MKLWQILRFEVAYQARRPWPWLAMAALIAFAMAVTRVGMLPVTLPQDFILNSPFIITTVTVLSCQIWLLVAPAVAGEAAARDVHTGIYPLMYTSSVSKAEYLGGRFLAALSLNALILLGVQAGSLLAVYAVETPPSVIGPFRPAAYLAAYGLVALPSALIATTIQFAVALWAGRPMAAYVGSFGLFFLSYPVTVFLYFSRIAGPEIPLLSDPIGVFAIMNEMMSNWTIAEKNVRMFSLEGHMLWNRLLWVGVSLGTLAFMYGRFRFAERTAHDLPGRLLRRFTGRAPVPDTVGSANVATPIPQVHRSFDFATRLRQTMAVAWSSFWLIARSPAGLFLLAAFPAMLVLILLVEMQQWGVPLLPRTVEIISRYLSPSITPSITDPLNYWVMVPLLIIFLAGELIWRERDARLDENVDATPVPAWVLAFGKYLGLCLALMALMTMVTAAGVVTQAVRGYYEFEIPRYLLLLFGFQLPEYLLFAMLVFAIQVIVDHKYVGPLVALVAYLLLVFPGLLGVQHKLLVYGGGPAWSFTEMRGFGASVGPWLWFKLYWAAWALLLAVLARLLWVRGHVSGFRLHIARRRFNRATAGATAMAAALVLVLGGFIFYNTNVLNEYITEDEETQRRAEYERRYGKYEGVPQPQRTSTKLHIELYPDRRAATIRGSYRLVNHHETPIDSVHLDPVGAQVSFDRPARRVVADDTLGYHIYVLDEPLQPGDSLTLSFEAKLERRGFRNTGLLRSNGAGNAILENGTFLTGGILPVLGYQPGRELTSAEERRKQGLPRKLTLPPPGDIDPNTAARPGATFDAIIGTAADQVAVAPGELRRTWTEAGRRYFHYASDVPIIGDYIFASAAYAVFRERWNNVDIQVFLHPGHTRHVDRLLRGIRESLDYYSAQFGPYPYPFLQLIEQPGNFIGMGVEGSGVIAAGEGSFLPDPRGDGLDLIFEVVAHEVGHQWWGMQLKPAFAEGGGVVSEGLAWYSAMRLVKHAKGRETLRRLMRFMREPSPWPQIRTGLPLLRAMDPWANYRKAPYAMNALAEYVGEDRINAVLRRLVENKAPSLATTLDLYRELQAVTPDSLKPLLRDLFEVNAFWSFDTKRASAVQTGSGAWRVTFEVEVHKVVVDSAGLETEVPMTEWVEIGVFAPAGPGEILGRPLYVEKHPIRSGTQTITVMVADRPARGGIDPYNLLDWEEGDNIEAIEIEGS